MVIPDASFSRVPQWPPCASPYQDAAYDPTTTKTSIKRRYWRGAGVTLIRRIFETAHRGERPTTEAGGLFFLVSASFYKPYRPTTSFNASVVPPLADSLRAAV